MKDLIRSKIYTFWWLSKGFYDKISGGIEKKISGIDFLSNVSPQKLGEGYINNKYVHYVPSTVFSIKKIVDALNINSNDSILDYGSGKGKAIYEFSKFSFSKIGGVELSEELFRISEQNMKKLKLFEIEIYNENALDFKKLSNYNHFFFFDPFSIDVFSGVINNIIESCKITPREIVIIYVHSRGHHKILEHIKGFSHFKTLQVPINVNIYKYAPNTSNNII